MNKILVAALLMSSSAMLWGQSTPSSTQELVQRVVANEIRAADSQGHYMYRLHKESADGSITSEVIETKDWLVGRLIQRNGQPLLPGQRQKEDERLTRLLTNRAALEQEREELEKDEHHARDLFKALPLAFDYQYASQQKGGVGDSLVRLKFHPNPQFQPPSQELRVLEGMEGTMLIDATAGRIVRIEARLAQPVSFGWGILARLNPGGTLLLEQRDVGQGRWQMTMLALHFTGKILLFKKLEIDSTRTTSDFRRMPDDLTLKEGLELLRKQDEMTNESRDPAKRNP